MESKLRTMFDYQKFEGNTALQQIIDSVHSRYTVRELGLDDMEWVSAAGTPEINLTGKFGSKDRDANRQS